MPALLLSLGASHGTAAIDAVNSSHSTAQASGPGGEEWSPWFPCFTNRFGGSEDKKDLTYIYALILLSSIYHVYERFEKNQCEIKQEKQIEGNSPHELV